MSVAASPPRVPWSEQLPPRPLCDVPWVGRANVLSDGSVNFCCFSDAVIGNVREQPLGEIWNAPPMQRIRGELAHGRFPEECRTRSCPLWRGDENSFLQTRMDGLFSARRTGSDDPHAAVRAQLRGCALRVEPARIVRGGRVEIRFELAAEGEPFVFDLFAAVRTPAGEFLFLPEWSRFPLPLVRGGTADPAAPRSLTLVAADAPVASGRFEITVALFLPESNPMLASNCLFSIVRELDVG